MDLNGVPDSTSFTHRFGPGQYTTSFIEPLRGLKVDFAGPPPSSALCLALVFALQGFLLPAVILFGSLKGDLG
jgi:hypothetical protein